MGLLYCRYSLGEAPVPRAAEGDGSMGPEPRKRTQSPCCMLHIKLIYLNQMHSSSLKKDRAARSIPKASSNFRAACMSWHQTLGKKRGAWRSREALMRRCQIGMEAYRIDALGIGKQAPACAAQSKHHRIRFLMPRFLKRWCTAARNICSCQCLNPLPNICSLHALMESTPISKSSLQALHQGFW